MYISSIVGDKTSISKSDNNSDFNSYEKLYGSIRLSVLVLSIDGGEIGEILSVLIEES